VVGKKPPDHLKMRISIRDDQDREIRSLRDLSCLGSLAAVPAAPARNTRLEEIRKAHEKTGLTNWSFPDLAPAIQVPQAEGPDLTLFPGLQVEPDNTVSLRLFQSEAACARAHKKGVRQLYAHWLSHLFKDLKKDIRKNKDLGRIARFFSGPDPFARDLHDLIWRHFFEKGFRTRAAFDCHGQSVALDFYARTQQILKTLVDLGNAYDKAFSLIQKRSFEYQKRPAAFEMLTRLFQELKDLVPPHFLRIYTLERIQELERYVACIQIRVQRAADNPGKERIKEQQVQPFIRKLHTLVQSLSETSSPEKADGVEAFFWLIEEYKISVFAPTIGTRVKVSAKRLEKELTRLSFMI
jgi:ATP-dependent helicase HrpA